MQKAPQTHSTTFLFIIVTINMTRFTDVYNFINELLNRAKNLWKYVEFSADSMQIYSIYSISQITKEMTHDSNTEVSSVLLRFIQQHW